MTVKANGQRRIAYMPLTDLPPAPRNPRLHDLTRIRASLARFGYADTVLLDERTGRLVAGHGRLEALTAMRAAGEPAPEGVRVVGKQWKIPVLRGWASRDDREADAYLLAANRLTELGGWDDRALAAMLRDLDDPGLSDTIGWDSDGVDALLATLNTFPPTTPGEFAEVPTDKDAEHRCPSCGYYFNGNPR